jgi:hypothetical protein
MTLSRPSLAALTSLLLACSDPFTPRAGTLTGTFGGANIELGFGSRVVRAALICSGAYFKRPIALDANGEFVLPRTTLRYPTYFLEVRGTVEGDQILATVIVTGPTGSTSDQRTLTRGTKADFSDFACAAS